MFIIWIQEIKIAYLKKNSISIQLPISLVSISCPVSYGGFSSINVLDLAFIFFFFP